MTVLVSHQWLLLSVLLWSILSQVLGAQQPSTVNDLAPDDLSKLQNDLAAWKASQAGLEAARMGIVTPSTTPTPTSAPSPLATSVGPSPAPAPTAPRPPNDQLQRFLNAKRTVESLQAAHPQTTFSLNTPFALLTPQEFAQFVNKSNVQAHRQLVQQQAAKTMSHHIRRTLNQRRDLQQQQQQQVPTTVDWQQNGCVAPVKNQGSCGICWIFAATAALESGYCVNSPTKTLPVLSEQDVMSCGPPKGSCSGGWTYIAYDWIVRVNGGQMCTEASVPYASLGGSGPSCTRYDNPNAKCDKVDLGFVSYSESHYENHHDLEAVVASRPVSVQIRAGLPYFQFYAGGVLMGDEQQCPSAYADHEVEIVGYGTRNGVQYWKVKNSWGTAWGEQGYVYIERGYQGAPYGTCGIETWAYYPIFKSQAPAIDNLRCGGVRNGVNIIGQTLKAVTMQDPFSGHCCDACRREPGCRAATWGGTGAYNVCVLKSTIDSVTFDLSSGFSSVMVLSKTDADNSMCLPTEDNVDFPGNDLTRTLTSTAGECCDKCIQDPNCGAYTWTKWMGGSCFLKYSKSSSKVNSPLPDGTPYFKSGEVYRCQPLQTNVDFYGNDLKNVKAPNAGACCNLCRNNYPCQAFSWSNYQGGTCWLKTKAGMPSNTNGVISATLY